LLSTLIEAITVSCAEDDGAAEDEAEAEDETVELVALAALLEAETLFSDEEELLATAGPHEAKTKSEEAAKTKRIECFFMR
jgi:DNA polymerase III delta subunit